MRRSLLLIIVLLATVPSTAATQRAVGRTAGPVTGAPWIDRATVRASDLIPGVDATSWETSAARPVVLLETNYYTYAPGDPLQLRMSTNPNGFSGPVTIYLYWENRRTGERRYYNTTAGALLPAGESADLFGIGGTAVPVTVPTLSDFVLFGSAGDTLNSWGKSGALGGSIATPANAAGLYQYVLEIRDGGGQRVIARSNAMYSYVEQTVNVTGTITTNTIWSANNRYVLSDFVGVRSPAVLTIEPGTVIYGGNSRATLFIQRGAKIVADGTNRRPIVFTSPQKVGSRNQSDWGSLVLLGAAPVNDNRNGLLGESYLEGLPQTAEYRFGGTNPNDSSGILRFVRLEFGGFEIEKDQEINGLSMAGVERGTVIDHVQVLHNKDDAFEFWGGTVDAKHLLGIAFADDGLDFDLGYQGRIQYAVMIKRAVNDENDANIMFETDGHPQSFTNTPKTIANVYNVTAIREANQFGNYGAVLRRGTGGRFFNTILTGTRHAPVTLRDDATVNNLGTDLVWASSIFHGDFSASRYPSSSDRAAATQAFLFETMKRNRNTDPLLRLGTLNAVTNLMPDVTPLPGSPALDLNFVTQTPDDGFFEPVDFIGGVGPHLNWVMSGWATFSDN